MIRIELQEVDTVRLAGSVTQAEFGLALCDDDGEPLQIDGKVWKTGGRGLCGDQEDAPLAATICSAAWECGAVGQT